jgi:hypothetical protein
LARAGGATPEPLDPRDRLEERLEFLAAMEELRHLPKNLRAVVLLRAQFGRHRDVAEVLGVSTARVAHLLQHVGVYLQERMERQAELERPVASPRAARLRELEVEPPEWLVEAIGRAPTFNKSSAKPVLAWRRAALAIDDYRNESGWHSKEVGVGPTPIRPEARSAHERAQRAIQQLSAVRALRRGHGFER